MTDQLINITTTDINIPIEEWSYGISRTLDTYTILLINPTYAFLSLVGNNHRVELTLQSDHPGYNYKQVVGHISRNDCSPSGHIAIILKNTKWVGEPKTKGSFSFTSQPEEETPESVDISSESTQSSSSPSYFERLASVFSSYFLT